MELEEKIAVAINSGDQTNLLEAVYEESEIPVIGVGLEEVEIKILESSEDPDGTITGRLSLSASWDGEHPSSTWEGMNLFGSLSAFLTFSCSIEESEKLSSFDFEIESIEVTNSEFEEPSDGDIESSSSALSSSLSARSISVLTSPVILSQSGVSVFSTMWLTMCSGV